MLTTAGRSQHEDVAFVKPEIKLGWVKDIRSARLLRRASARSSIFTIGGLCQRGLCKTHDFLLNYICTNRTHINFWCWLSLMLSAGWEISNLWLIVVVVCPSDSGIVCHHGQRVPHNAPRYNYVMPISCHRQDCIALLLSMLLCWYHASSNISGTGHLHLSLLTLRKYQVTGIIP